MSKHEIPERFGPFRKIDPFEEPFLMAVLKDLLPRSRRLYEALQLTKAGFEAASPIYVPAEETKENFSGIALSLFGEYHEPTTAISFTSRKEDAKKVT